MRLYGGKYLRNQMQDKMNLRTETRDAILYDYDETNRYARVKIQGTDTLIRAYYPTNWSQKPEWLKPGNAVKIVHTGGNRGRVELLGHGGLVPTPVPGGSGAPAPDPPGDSILTGMVTLAVSGEGMVVQVTTGTYRLGGVVYSWPPSGESDRVSIGASSPTYFRYDRVVARAYVSGQAQVYAVSGEWFSTPDSNSLPATPSAHMSLSTVLVYPAVTAIVQDAINLTWTTPRAVKMNLVLSPSDHIIEWGESGGSLACTIVDQYDNTIGKASPGYHVVVNIASGNGTLSYGGNSGSSLDFYTTSGNFTITYTRGGTAGDESPVITVEVDSGLYGGADYFILWDEYDAPMWPD